MEISLELQMGEDLKAILAREITHIKEQAAGEVNPVVLEKLSKTYTTLMDDLRKSKEAGIFE
jgi:hypothetical protein